MSDDFSPAISLSEEIANALVEKGLLRKERKDPLIARIADGKMSAADWKTEIDLAVEKAGKA